VPEYVLSLRILEGYKSNFCVSLDRSIHINQFTIEPGSQGFPSQAFTN
jgi:hypothetical protein